MENYLYALLIWSIIASIGRWYYVELQLREERKWHKHYRQLALMDQEFALALLDRLNEMGND